ncbi:MAG TPA: SagB/ThcOx family dehydrogenase [Sedimentisphaerales bacterium]|nr:SagB/ThcOx family dehydrogenase [Sedimentisphaerales bacterium]
MGNVSDEFQQQTKYRPDMMGTKVVRRGSRPELYKTYPQSKKVSLPMFEPEVLMTLDRILGDRKSVRSYQPKPLSLGQLSYLLWASNGIQRIEQGYEFRTAPSAGALYPIETYIVANDVSELEPGVYHYGLRNHELEQIRTGGVREAIAAAALGQTICARAPVVFAWTAIFARSTCKYGQRAYRYIYLDAGHIAENLALAAVSLDLGTCQIGALFDDEVNKLLGVNGVEESIVYMSVVGVPA